MTTAPLMTSPAEYIASSLSRLMQMRDWMSLIICVVLIWNGQNLTSITSNCRKTDVNEV